MNQEQLLDFLISKGQAWILEQRELYRPGADRLDQATQISLEPFFRSETLDSARYQVVPLIENPGFYSELEAMGQSVPLDFTTVHGITFQDTVLLSKQYKQSGGFPRRLIFHELVHVVQYRHLGVADFVRRYVSGWAANGYGYLAIPLERDAYELDERFDMNPTQPFSVEVEISRRLGLSA